MSESTSYNGLLAIPPSLLLVIGLAWAGSQGSAQAGAVPLFALCMGLALLIQWIAFVPAFMARTERFYDLTGSLTYLGVTGIAVGLGPELDARSGLLAVLVGAWAARLGTFLFRRIHKNTLRFLFHRDVGDRIAPNRIVTDSRFHSDFLSKSEVRC